MPLIRTIQEGLAYGLWEHAWDNSGHDGSMPWPPPAAVIKAARDLESLYVAKNGKQSVRALMEKEGMRDAGEFGYVLAQLALGVQLPERRLIRRGPNGKQIGRVKIVPAGPPTLRQEIGVPTFTASLDGLNEFSWEGGVDDNSTYSEEEVFGRGHETPRGARIKARPFRSYNPPRDPHEVPHVKTVAETRRILAKMDSCSSGCPGWAVFETNRGFEIQVCDECNRSLATSQRLSDDDVAQLPEAKKALAETEAEYTENPPGRRVSYELVEPTVGDDVYIEETVTHKGDTVTRAFELVTLKREEGVAWKFRREDGSTGHTSGPFYKRVTRMMRNPCDAEPNPAGIFTDKGERMYEEVKAGYGDDPRAAELAARTVYARARDGVSGLLRVGKGPPPGVPRGR